MAHEQIVPQNQLYSPQPMGRLYPRTHCTMHGPWADCALELIVQCMAHGQIILWNSLYNPWYMPRLYPRTHCTMHGTWLDYTLAGVLMRSVLLFCLFWQKCKKISEVKRKILGGPGVIPFCPTGGISELGCGTTYIIATVACGIRVPN